MDGQGFKLKVQQPNLHNPSLKRSSPSIFGQTKSKSVRKRGRTKADFLDFCATVLNYENYHPEEPSSKSSKVETDYNMNNHSSPVRDSLGGSKDSLGGSNSDSGGSNGTHGYDGSSTATAASSSPSACSSDEDEPITCFCKKPFANRPMIQCGSCETWIHLSCAKIRRTHIPDVYICNTCRDASQTARKSSRPRVENKKFVEKH